jgi:hypothetical protein
MSEQLTITDRDQKSQDNFLQYITGLKPGMKRQYDRHVNRDLSQQNSQGVFRRNIIVVLDEVYDVVLKKLKQSPSGTIEVSTTEILGAFDGFIEELIQYALQKHRGSCALSNFPEEHNPDKHYIAEVLAEVQKGWNAFTFQVERIIQDK